MRTRPIRRLLVIVAALALQTAPARALDILLTNDDGFDAVGIQTLKAALEAANHNVTMVAPFGESSGSSAKINLTPVFPIPVGVNAFGLVALEEILFAPPGTREEVPATPATCVLFGLSVVLGGVAPDLIVSGTNVGANVGNAVPFSGTVGGATAGIIADVPSIAFSSDPPADEEDVTQHYVNVADFAVRFIAHLETKPGALSNVEGLLPPRIGLNVNYPTLAPEDVAGVQLTVQGRSSTLTLIFEELVPPGGIFIPAVEVVPDPPPDVKDADTEALASGFITVTPIDADLTAPPPNGQSFESVLVGVTP